MLFGALGLLAWFVHPSSCIISPAPCLSHIVLYCFLAHRLPVTKTSRCMFNVPLIVGPLSLSLLQLNPYAFSSCPSRSRLPLTPCFISVYCTHLSLLFFHVMHSPHTLTCIHPSSCLENSLSEHRVLSPLLSFYILCITCDPPSSSCIYLLMNALSLSPSSLCSI